MLKAVEHIDNLEPVEGNTGERNIFLGNESVHPVLTEPPFHLAEVFWDIPEQQEFLEDCERRGFVLEALVADKDILGVFVTVNDQKIFLQRDPNAGPEAVTTALKEMMRSETMEIIDGEVVRTAEGVKQRVRKLGEMVIFKTPEIKTVTKRTRDDVGLDEAPKYKVPKKFNRSRLLTLASKDDGPGKTMWRKTLDEMAREVFPEGVELIPAGSRKILFFPGLGGEVEQWEKFGFREEDFIFVESDPVLADALADRYPKAYIVRSKFHLKPGKWISELNEHLKDQKIGVVSIDPENALSHSFMSAIEAFFMRAKLADECFVGVNFSTGRESEKTLTFYEGISTLPPEDLEKEDLELLRLSAISNAIPLAARVASDSGSVEFEVSNLRKGHYEGNRRVRMYFSMHKVKKV